MNLYYINYEGIRHDTTPDGEKTVARYDRSEFYEAETAEACHAHVVEAVNGYRADYDVSYAHVVDCGTLTRCELRPDGTWIGKTADWNARPGDRGLDGFVRWMMSSSPTACKIVDGTVSDLGDIAPLIERATVDVKDDLEYDAVMHLPDMPNHKLSRCYVRNALLHVLTDPWYKAGVYDRGEEA